MAAKEAGQERVTRLADRYCVYSARPRGLPWQWPEALVDILPWAVITADRSNTR